MEACPQESKKVRDKLVVRGFSEGIHNSQVRRYLRRSLVDVDWTNETILELALHFETVTRSEEDEREPKVAVRQHESTERLIKSMNELVEY